jgi:(R,R)-butanediol dehydrogenase / meso-butanediol dehydrogenase / diacetyl reductase
MRAAVYHGDHDVRITDVVEPEQGDGEVLLRVLRSGMCGTDATEWKSGPRTFPVDRVHPVTGHTGPMIMGHEFVGEVLRSTPGGRYSIGDVVASGAGVSCGTCDRCREGRTNVCRRYYTLGLNTAGGLAELVTVPETTLAPVPDELSIDAAGLAQPMAVGLHAARRSGVGDGDRVVLIGAGAIGTFVLTALRSLADVDVTVIDLPGSRLERATRLGATRVVEAGLVASEVRELLGGPADLAIEASGAPGQLDKAVSLLRPAGSVLQVGIPGTPQQVDVHPIVMQEISVLTTLAHVCGVDLAPALEILAATDVAAELLDSVHPLDDVPAQLERLATGGLEGKVLFDPTIEGSSHS